MIFKTDFADDKLPLLVEETLNDFLNMVAFYHFNIGIRRQVRKLLPSKAVLVSAVLNQQLLQKFLPKFYVRLGLVQRGVYI